MGLVLSVLFIILSHEHLMNHIFFVFIGGGIGSVLRFLLSKYMTSNFTHINPIATLSSNVLATLILAFLMYFIHDKNPMDLGWKFFAVTGICGGFSTFSTFSYETYELFKLNMPIYAILNVTVSIALVLIVMYLMSRLA